MRADCPDYFRGVPFFSLFYSRCFFFGGLGPSRICAGFQTDDKEAFSIMAFYSVSGCTFILGRSIVGQEQEGAI